AHRVGSEQIVRAWARTPPPGPLPEAERGSQSSQSLCLLPPPLRFGEGAGGRGPLPPPLRFGEGAGGRGFPVAQPCERFTSKPRPPGPAIPRWLHFGQENEIVSEPPGQHARVLHAHMTAAGFPRSGPGGQPSGRAVLMAAPPPPPSSSTASSGCEHRAV